ncbi:voltage-gated protein/chloride channel-like protein [Aulographum hederae CBS 113979]|uniref:Voltage-gated protein/chloride channel-like protein n=1 Tax=Aulographum hederae CBS 113979 TaxID=1176131 RepID=A0A6G1HDV4_9PEZI|nr:voltage-gated protein/chloride channel-like protein [Aulographum hederae CBS 113979]
MPKSVASYYSAIRSEHDDNDDDEDDNDEGLQFSRPRRGHGGSPVLRRHRSDFVSESDLQQSASTRTPDERSSLLGESRAGFFRTYTGSMPGTPRPFPIRYNSHHPSIKISRANSRRGSFSHRLVNALSGTERLDDSTGNLQDSKPSVYVDDRVWYDQFTSTDWVHDSIADAYRVKTLRSRKDLRGRILAWFDGAQGWLLVAIIGCLTAFIAYFVNVTESVLFDYKFGYCSLGWYMSHKKCCSGASLCEEWSDWSKVLGTGGPLNDSSAEYGMFILGVVVLSSLSCLLTLLTKTVIPSAFSLATLDENLAAENSNNLMDEEGRKQNMTPAERFSAAQSLPPMVYYSAAGSGVAEVRVILSGFVLHGYLGVRTLVIKTLALVLSVASGLSLGKEGPYVHIATCIGNILCRLFPKYNHNDGKRREVLSASAASGVAVAFGAPIAGVLFSLEEVSYYFPPKTLFRTFFCCIAAALSLKFLNPYGTNKIVLFEVRYLTDWKGFEMVAFILVGIIGGAMGALFIKASKFWARTFRRIPFIKKYPLFEVVLVALLTGVVSFWNRYTKLPVTELLFELASPCDTFTSSGTGLCPTREQIPEIIRYLTIAFVVKALLTVVTFGIKVPAGIYVPSMVVGGLLGRIVGHIVQYLALTYSHTGLFGDCSIDAAPESCVVPGVYAMVAAGATMCGVTRLSVTLAVILFELTGSLDHVLPFSIGVLVSKWTADAIEPLSIYDLLTNMNSYPFLDNKVRPVFSTELGDITPRVRSDRVIDISASPLVPATELRDKLNFLHLAGELDGGLPIIRDNILTGLIPAPDLEFALDKLENEENSLCLMSAQVRWAAQDDSDDEETGGGGERQEDRTDFTPYIDPAPVSLEIHSPMDLVYECFVKLGLRYICVLRDGRFAGLVHKKAFVKYCKELEEKHH